MNNRLIPDLWNLIANKYLNPETILRMQILDHGFFAKNISEETLALHQMITYYPDVLKNYRCPSERKNWKDIQVLVLAQYCDANNDEICLNLLLAARAGSVTKLKAAKLTLDQIFDIKDHNGDNLVSLTKKGKCIRALDHFDSIARAELELKGDEKAQALALLKDEKYHPAFYWQSAEKVIEVLQKFYPHLSADQKIEITEKTFEIAIKNGRTDIVDSILKACIFPDEESGADPNKSDVVFGVRFSLDDIENYIIMATQHEQNIVKCILDKVYTYRSLRHLENGVEEGFSQAGFSFNRLFRTLYSNNLNKAMQQYGFRIEVLISN